MSNAQYVACAKLPEPPNASWSNVLRLGREIHVSGVHAHPHTRDATLDAYEQTCIILDRLQLLLESAGGGLHNIYKLVVYAKAMEMKDGVAKARSERLGPVYPCSTFLVVQGFAFQEVDVELDAWSNLDVDLRRVLKAV
jgi:2-iminobutanoate/2-iminopropanoate deaminase